VEDGRNVLGRPVATAAISLLLLHFYFFFLFTSSSAAALTVLQPLYPFHLPAALLRQHTSDTMGQESEADKYHDPEDFKHDAVFAEKTEMADYKADAIDAENEEHNMTVLQAVRAYPMASFWAFVMSCTIVRGAPTIPLPPSLSETSRDDRFADPVCPACRSWSPTTSSSSETSSPSPRSRESSACPTRRTSPTAATSSRPSGRPSSKCPASSVRSSAS